VTRHGVTALDRDRARTQAGRCHGFASPSFSHDPARFSGPNAEGAFPLHLYGRFSRHFHLPAADSADSPGTGIMIMPLAVPVSVACGRLARIRRG
jgi:hypothetical protein